MDKDGHVSAPFTPPAEALAQRTSAQAVEYMHSAWWFLGDVAKYLERRSWYEAVERLGVARDYLLRLVAIGARTRFPQYGLVSLVDFAPHAIPARLDVTYPSPRDPESILSAAVTIAELIDDALVDASRATGKPLASRLAEDVRARLARVALNQRPGRTRAASRKIKRCRRPNLRRRPSSGRSCRPVRARRRVPDRPRQQGRRLRREPVRST